MLEPFDMISPPEMGGFSLSVLQDEVMKSFKYF